MWLGWIWAHGTQRLEAAFPHLPPPPLHKDPATPLHSSWGQALPFQAFPPSEPAAGWLPSQGGLLTATAGKRVRGSEKHGHWIPRSNLYALKTGPSLVALVPRASQLCPASQVGRAVGSEPLYSADTRSPTRTWILVVAVDGQHTGRGHRKSLPADLALDSKDIREAADMERGSAPPAWL